MFATEGNFGLTQKSRTTRKTTTVRVDTLLLANYGILQPTRRRLDAITVNSPLDELTEEDKLDLFEFATFMMSDDRQYDFRPIPWTEATDQHLQASSDENDEFLRDEV
jgi:hypothetical protein